MRWSAANDSLLSREDWHGSVGAEDLDFRGIDGPVATLACSLGKWGEMESVWNAFQRRSLSWSHRYHQWKPEYLWDRRSRCRRDECHRALLTVRALIEFRLLFLLQIGNLFVRDLFLFGNIQ
jgi:hypothetical protein